MNQKKCFLSLVGCGFIPLVVLFFFFLHSPNIRSITFRSTHVVSDTNSSLELVKQVRNLSSIIVTPKPPSPSLPPSPPSQSSSTVAALPCDHIANLTVLSGFFDIGDHGKGGGRRRISEYFGYSASLAYIHTPLVFYTDSDQFVSYLTKLRSRLHPKLTTIIKVNRSELWPFNLKPSIATLYATKGYPKHQPNTVVPEYSCSQHAKYACLLDLILNRTDVRKSDVYAWLDFGYFRQLNNKKEYCLKLPDNFNPSMPSYNQVFTPNFKLTPKSIYYQNRVWVGGGMFIAARDTMVKLCKEYRRSVEYWLFKRNLSSTDQQNMYASFTEEGRREVNFSLELNVKPGGHGWFELGNSCLQEITLP